jgi:activator of 2-hydroxyglutaryl-CoA dehydratase
LKGLHFGENYYLGVDVGSVSTNLVLMDEACEVCGRLYLKTSGRPVETLKGGLLELAGRFGINIRIRAAGATGSGRQLAGLLINADVIKNEITAHAVAAASGSRTCTTILEIGGQDSKSYFSKTASSMTLP